MNYHNFYQDIADWINNVNQLATTHEFGSSEFWEHVMRSAGEVSDKYDNQEIVHRQFEMLIDWLQGIYNKQIER